MKPQRKVTVTIHTTSEDPYWSIEDSTTGEIIHSYIEGWLSKETGDVCESTTMKKLREYCEKREWSVTEAWS